MIKRSLTGLAVVVCGSAVWLTAGTGIASAGSMVDTTCTYKQFVAALMDHNPPAYAVFEGSLQMQSALRKFLNAPPDQRAQIAQLIMAQSEASPYLGGIEEIFDVCNNY